MIGVSDFTGGVLAVALPDVHEGGIGEVAIGDMGNLPPPQPKLTVDTMANIGDVGNHLPPPPPK